MKLRSLTQPMTKQTDKQIAQISQWCTKHGYSWHSKLDGKQVIIDKATGQVVRTL